MYRNLVVLLLAVFLMGSSQPVWTMLEEMSIDERHNSSIDLMLEPNATEEGWTMAHNIESLWNSGKYEQALVLFPKLGQLTDAEMIGISNTWREPVPTHPKGRWGKDVRINYHDSVDIVSMDIHHPSGNLFAIIQFQEGSNSFYSVNYSNDGGLIWYETAVVSPSLWISASVYGNHCYVAGSGETFSYIRRYKFSDATGDSFSNGSHAITVFIPTPPTLIKEIALTSFADGDGNRLYYFDITSDGVLHFFWADSSAVSWTELSPGITDAKCGLDACTNQDYIYYLLFSYLNTSNELLIYGRRVGSWDELVQSSSGGNIAEYSAIGAYKDTMVCVYEYYKGPSVPKQISGFQSKDGANSWYMFNIDDTTSHRPDITLRNGGGVGMAYQYILAPSDGRFIWGNYDEYWYQDTPTRFTEYSYVYSSKPSIEYLGNSIYGIVYIGYDVSFDLRGAYFDRSDWTGVWENKSDDINSQVMSLKPNPSIGNFDISYAITKQGLVKVDLYDISGRLVRNLLEETKSVGTHFYKIRNLNLVAGVYFIRLDTPNKTETQTITIVR